MSATVANKTAARPAQTVQPLLDIRDLNVVYATNRGIVRAVQDVSFAIQPGEVFGLAGESGCGKTTIGYAITRLHKPPAYITGGQVLFDGRDLLPLSQDEIRSVRWKDISIVPQSAMNALNPVITVGEQITDAIHAHMAVSKREAQERAAEMLRMVGIDPSRLGHYPHQFSGGMRQRAVIAIALALKPRLVVLDEPTTALDVVVQRDIMQQLAALKTQLGFSMLFITHDLSLMVEFSDRIGVMYAGKLVEVAAAQDLFTAPRHPYTQGLMGSFPSIAGPRRQLRGIPGNPPDLISPPPGCRFHPRCPVAMAGRCDRDVPELFAVGSAHLAACHWVQDHRGEPQDAWHQPAAGNAADLPVAEGVAA
jgi:peptide/nickel transport system ATP-binding protein